MCSLTTPEIALGYNTCNLLRNSRFDLKCGKPIPEHIAAGHGNIFLFNGLQDPKTRGQRQDRARRKDARRYGSSERGGFAWVRRTKTSSPLGARKWRQHQQLPPACPSLSRLYRCLLQRLPRCRICTSGRQGGLSLSKTAVTSRSREPGPGGGLMQANADLPRGRGTGCRYNISRLASILYTALLAQEA